MKLTTVKFVHFHFAKSRLFFFLSLENVMVHHSLKPKGYLAVAKKL